MLERLASRKDIQLKLLESCIIMNAEVFIGVCLLLATVASASGGVIEDREKLLHRYLLLSRNNFGQLNEAMMAGRQNFDSQDARDRTVKICQKYEGLIAESGGLNRVQEQASKPLEGAEDILHACKEILYGVYRPLPIKTGGQIPQIESHGMSRSEVEPELSDETLDSFLRALANQFGELFAAVTADHPKISLKKLDRDVLERYPEFIVTSGECIIYEKYLKTARDRVPDCSSNCDLRQVAKSKGESAEELWLNCKELVYGEEVLTFSTKRNYHRGKQTRISKTSVSELMEVSSESREDIHVS